jgi:hypothetical protein
LPRTAVKVMRPTREAHEEGVKLREGWVMNCQRICRRT